jgi:MFS family permease
MTEHQHDPDGPYLHAGGLGYTSGERVVRAPKLPMALGAGRDGLRELAPPSIVKRNTLLLAASQAFVGVGNQMVPTLGAIIVARLLGSTHLAGMATSTLGVSRFLVSYPIGRVADLYGRRIAVVLGLVLGLAGALGTGLSVLSGSFALFLASILVFGAGVSAGYQLRVAAADMYPPTRRAQGLGFVLTGSLVGALGGPILITAAQSWSGLLGVDPLALTWILVPVVIVPAIGLVVAIRPDPKDIAADLGRYHRGYSPPQEQAVDGAEPRAVLTFLRDPRLQVAFAASFAAQGNMSMIMAFTSLALEHHGHSLPVISVAVTIHVIGMFGFSLPLGWLADRAGRRAVMVLGFVFLGGGAVLLAATPRYWMIVTGTFMVGVGWSAATVAATAVIADVTRSIERGRAIGANDTASAAAAIALPLLAGPAVELFGLSALGMLGAGLMVPPVVLLLTRMKEPTPRHRAEGIPLVTFTRAASKPRGLNSDLDGHDPGRTAGQWTRCV